MNFAFHSGKFDTLSFCFFGTSCVTLARSTETFAIILRKIFFYHITCTNSNGDKLAIRAAHSS